MRSHTVSNEGPRRGQGKCAHDRRDVNVDVNVDDAGWPLGRHGKNSTRSEEGAMASRAVHYIEERHSAMAQMSSDAEERSFDILAHEVEELIERQPQFAFLKPCRQLEKHYASKRNAGQVVGNSSFRHSDRGVTSTEATASKNEKEVKREVRGISTSQRSDVNQKSGSRTLLDTEQLGPDHVDARPGQASRRKLEDRAKAAQCRPRDSDAKPGSTIRELLSTPSGKRDVEHGLRETASDLRVSVRRQHLVEHNATSVTSSKHSVASISFKCKEEDPGRPKSIAAAAQRALARKLSRDGIELNSFVEGKSGSPGAAARAGKVLTKEHHEVGLASPRRSASERFSGRGHFHRNSGERIWRISSTRCSIHEKEAHIDLVAPAAAKFLMETVDSPQYTLARHYNASPPAVAVPFKWEDAPGKAKVDTAARKPDTLQLPPRLAVPLQRSSESLSRELRISVFPHPLAGLFPCMTASSPPRPQQHDPAWMHYRASKSLPPKQSYPQHGYSGHQDMLPKSGDRCLNHRKLNKSFSQPLTSTDHSLNLKPRRLFSSELKPSHPWMQQGGHSSVPPSDSTSILHGSRQSSSSRTYLSCELDASTPRTTGSKSSSSASYESIGEDFDHDDSASPKSYINKPLSFDSPTSPGYAETPTFKNFGPAAMHNAPGKRSHAHRSEGVKGLLKLCKNHGNCLGKSKSRQRLGPLCSPEVWAPTLATYFQRLDVNEPAMSSGLLDKQGAPTSSGYLNCNGEPLPINNNQPATASDVENLVSLEISPERATRLPYKMPSVAEQERAARDPRKAANLSPGIRGGRHNNCTSGSRSLSTSTPARLDKYWISNAQASHREDSCPSPAYTAALEMLSPAVNLMTSRRHKASRNVPSSTWSSPKPHRRVQFILSICKTLKRVLFRQQPRRSVIGTRLMYHDDRAPTTFQFSKPN